MLTYLVFLENSSNNISLFLVGISRPRRVWRMPLQISDLKCCRLSKSDKKNCPNKLRILPLSSIKLAVVDGTIVTDTHQHQLSRTCIVWALYIYLWKLCWKTVFVDLCRQRNTLFQGCQNFINLSKAQRSDKITPEKGTYSNCLLF